MHQILLNLSETGGIASQVKQAFSQMGHDLINLLPKITIALAIFIIGLLVAKLIRSFLTKTFRAINLDGLLEKAGLGGLFKKLGANSEAAEIIPKVIYYLILLLVIRTAADSAGIQDVTNIINMVMAFLPKAILAGIIMLVGFLVADLLQNALFRILDSMGLDYASTLSKLMSGFVFILALTVALPQLGIETELLNDSVKIILGGIALALALALGLGLKVPAHNVVSGVYARDLYKPGTTVNFEGTVTKVIGVGPLTTKLQANDGSFLIVPNSSLVSSPVKGRSAE